MHKQIREFNLSTSFLVCGVDEHAHPHVFSVNNPNGNQIVHDARGHAAIGTGAQMALGALGSRPIATLPIRDLIYRVCEAKFAAETAPGVGKSTLALVQRKGSKYRIAFPNQIQRLQDVWTKGRTEPAPKKAHKIIDEIFADCL
jgi:20S proteasome alpha/beta subunit